MNIKDLKKQNLPKTVFKLTASADKLIAYYETKIMKLQGGLKLHNDYLEKYNRLSEFNNFINTR
jgi:phage terminase large subunit